MDDYNSQQQLHALKGRVSELSFKYSPSIRTYDPFASQLHDLKAQMASMQERLTRYEGSMPQITFADARNAFETRSRLTLPSGPRFWQLFERLRTDVQSLDNLVGSLESTVSDLEDKIDDMDPNRFTPPGSAADSEAPSIPNFNAPNHVGNLPPTAVLELSSDPTFPSPANIMQTPTVREQSGEHPSRPHLRPQEPERPNLIPIEQFEVENELRSNITSIGRLWEQHYGMLNSNGKRDPDNYNLAQAVQDLHPGYGERPSVDSGTEPPGRLSQRQNAVEGVPVRDREMSPKAPRTTLQKFQNIEDALECLCGVHNGSLPSPENRPSANVAIYNHDILEDVCAVMSYLANKNLEEAILKGDKSLHFDELRAVTERRRYPAQGTVMDDGNAPPCKHVRDKNECLTHGHPDWIACRKERKRQVTERNIRQREDEQVKIAQERLRKPTFVDSGAELPAVSHLRSPVESLAFRDREIERMDEQLAIVQESLRVSEDTVAQKQNLIVQLQRERDDCSAMTRDWAARNSELNEEMFQYRSSLQAKEGEISYLYDQIEDRDKTLRNWEESWTRLHESYQDASAKAKACERSLREERERNVSAIDRVIRDHRREMKALQNFCEQKDAVIYKQEQIISRGGKLLEQRDVGIEHLQREIRALEDNGEVALRTARRTNHLLEEKDFEIANLKEVLQAKGAKHSSDVFKEDNHSHSLNRTKAGETERATNPKDQERQTNGLPAHETPKVTRAPNRSSHRTRNAYLWEKPIPENEQGSMGNPSPRRSSSHGKRPGIVEGRVSSLPYRSEVRDDWQTPPPFNVRSRETFGQDFSPISVRQPTEGPALDDATLRPPLPAPPLPVRHVVSEANLRTASPNNNAISARKSLSKYQSMEALRGRLQAYVESDAESGGEFGGEV